jgi:hypothetical protein
MNSTELINNNNNNNNNNNKKKKVKLSLCLTNQAPRHVAIAEVDV